MLTDVMSQSQIDELLSELSNGIERSDEFELKKETKKIKDYDFKTPKKLTKEQIKLLAGIYESFSRHLASYFSGILRSYCSITVNSIEEQPYYEYNNALPDIVQIGILDAKPVEGSVLVDISNSISFFLIERLLGGSGDGGTWEREYTEIELKLMEGIFQRISEYMQESWSHFCELEVSLQSIGTNSRLIQSMPMDEVVAIIVLDVSIKDMRGTITFCIPCINIESLIVKVGHAQFIPKRTVDTTMEEIYKESMIGKIKNSPIEICGIFGNTVLTLGEVVNLQVGDVIKLDQSINSDITLTVHGSNWFNGAPGIKKNKKAIKINKVFLK